MGHTVHLRDLSFMVNGARTVKRLLNGSIEQAPRGVFVVVSLTLTNESHSVQRVAHNQFELVLDLERYHPDQPAMLFADSRSLLDLAAGGLRPGETLTGDLVFDVPRGKGAELIGAGFIAGASFATVASGRVDPDVRIGLSHLS